MESHRYLADLPAGTELTQIDFNLMICEAIGVDPAHVASYTIHGTADDVIVAIEWVDKWVKPGDPLTGRFVLLPATDITTEVAREDPTIRDHLADPPAFTLKEDET